jgi:hypothetical protein
MTDDDRRDEELQPSWPQGVVMAHEPGVRVFWLQADDMQVLVDRLALVLSEHMDAADELHVTYNAMQSGWQEHPARKGSVLRAPESAWTDLRFEYSAFVILRGAARP